MPPRPRASTSIITVTGRLRAKAIRFIADSTGRAASSQRAAPPARVQVGEARGATEAVDIRDARSTEMITDPGRGIAPPSPEEPKPSPIIATSRDARTTPTPTPAG